MWRHFSHIIASRIFALSASQNHSTFFAYRQYITIKVYLFAVIISFYTWLLKTAYDLILCANCVKYEFKFKICASRVDFKAQAGDFYFFFSIFNIILGIAENTYNILLHIYHLTKYQRKTFFHHTFHAIFLTFAYFYKMIIFPTLFLALQMEQHKLM